MLIIDADYAIFRFFFLATPTAAADAMLSAAIFRHSSLDFSLLSLRFISFFLYAMLPLILLPPLILPLSFFLADFLPPSSVFAFAAFCHCYYAAADADAAAAF